MANRRMFSKDITDADAFLDMPLSSQALYFHLGMNADDDGFLGSAKRIMRTIGCSDDDFKILVAKRFVLLFEDGVCVIKHWKMNNQIRKDRYKQTVYTEKLKSLKVKQNGSYTDVTTIGIPNGNQMETQYSIGKDSIVEDSKRENKKSRRFTPPSLQQVDEYCKERNNGIDAEQFLNFYDSKGWFVGKNKMKDWKAAVRTWEKRNNPKKDDEFYKQEIQKLRGDDWGSKFRAKYGEELHDKWRTWYKQEIFNSAIGNG